MVTRELKAALLSTSVRTSKTAVWANLLALVAIVVAAVGVVAPMLLWGWALAVLAVLVLRYLHIVWQGGRKDFPEPLEAVSRHYVGGVAAVAATFAAGVLLLSPSLDDHRRVLVLFALAGMCAGGTVVLAGHRPAFFSYVLLLLLPSLGIALWRLTQLGGTAQWAEFLAVAAFLLCILGAQKHVHGNSRALLMLKMKQDALSEALGRVNGQLEQERDDFRERALTDGLTGIANRRCFDDSLDEEWGRGARAGTSLGVLLMDIDQFKLYNDHYGHDEGDDCLKIVARVIESVARRGGDRAARFGGEEFVVLLPDTDLDGAVHVADAIRAAVSARRLPHVGSTHGHVTVSVGVASTVPSRDRSVRVLLKRADKALYAAKDGGRNRVATDILDEDPTVTQLVDLPAHL